MPREKDQMKKKATRTTAAAAAVQTRLEEHDRWERGIQMEIAATLARIDERLKNIDGVVAQMVTQAEFKPVKSIVYGLVGSSLLALLGAVIALVLK